MDTNGDVRVHRSATKSLRINKSYQNESISSDYSTPKTTKSFLTRSTRGSGNIRTSKYQLIYRPLELDNESSSESTDSIMRRRNFGRSPQNVMRTPLAIKARPKSKSTESSRYNRQSIYEPEVILTIRDIDENITKPVRKSPEVKGGKKRKLDDMSPFMATKKEVISRPLDKTLQDQNQIEIIDLCQCITPPITPEKVNEEGEQQQENNKLTKLSAFVPGSCDIEEVIRVYGSSIKKTTQPNTKVQKESEA